MYVGGLSPGEMGAGEGADLVRGRLAPAAASTCHCTTGARAPPPTGNARTHVRTNRPADRRGTIFVRTVIVWTLAYGCYRGRTDGTYLTTIVGRNMMH